MEKTSRIENIFRKQQPTRDSSVLLIDSDSATVAIVRTLLEDQQYIVRIASSVEEAFSRLSEAALPDTHGQQFVEQARLRFRRAVFPPMRLLSVTDGGYPTANLLQVEAYLPKPFDNEDLLMAKRDQAHMIEALDSSSMRRRIDHDHLDSVSFSH